MTHSFPTLRSSDLDAAAADQGGGESEDDAELLEDDGDGVLVLRHRDGELTASEEAGCLAGDSRQVGFRKDGDQVVLGQGIDQRINRGIADVTAAEDRVDAGDRRQRLQAELEAAVDKDVPIEAELAGDLARDLGDDRKSTRLNSSH